MWLYDVTPLSLYGVDLYRVSYTYQSNPWLNLVFHSIYSTVIAGLSDDQFLSWCLDL